MSLRRQLPLCSARARRRCAWKPSTLGAGRQAVLRGSLSQQSLHALPMTADKTMHVCVLLGTAPGVYAGPLCAPELGQPGNMSL